MASTTPAPSPTGLISKTTTQVLSTDLNHVEHTISSVHVNGWLLLAAGVGLNLIGVIFHF